jgi:hypothetical protein
VCILEWLCVLLGAPALHRADQPRHHGDLTSHLSQSARLRWYLAEPPGHLRAACQSGDCASVALVGGQLNSRAASA